MLQALLGSAGLTPDDLEIVEYPDFGQGAAVIAGAVDAATGFTNNEPVQLELTGEDATILRVDEITPLPGNGLIVGSATIDAKRDAVAAFVAATLRAMEEIAANPEVGLDAAIAAVPELGTARETQAAILDATIEVWTGPAQEAAGLGAIAPGRLGRLDRLPDVARPRAESGHVRPDAGHLAPADAGLTVVLGGIRPSGARRSWWLREALAAEAASAPHLAAAAPPLRGTTTADVVVIGGGYTGLWTAYRLTELEPGARVVLVEADICGGGPSGRNGGFATNWWDELPTLIERYGEAGALSVAQAMEDAVDEIGTWCATHGVDAWYTKAGALQAVAAPAQDGSWDDAVAACRAVGREDRYRSLTADEVRARVDSPVFRSGVFMPGAATIQPATLARGLRRVLLERGVVIHEGTRVDEIDGQRPGWLGSVGAGARRAPARRVGPAGTLRPIRVRTSSDGGAGEVLAGIRGRRAQRLGRRVAVVRSAPRHVVVVHGHHRADPGPPGGHRLDRRRGRQRRPVHAALPADDARRADRHRRRWRTGRVQRSRRRGLHRRRPVRRASRGRTAATLPVAAGRPPRGRLGRTDRYQRRPPAVVRVRARTAPIHYGHGYSGNGVAPSVVGGRILAARAAGARGRSGPRRCRSRMVRCRGRSRRSRRGISGRGSSARLPCAASRPRSGARRLGRSPASCSRISRRLGYHLGPE